MATARQIMKQAAQDIGVLGVGKSLSPTDEADILSRLNDMLDNWSTSSIMVPFRTEISHSLDGSASYTVGSGADISTTRPSYINSAFIRDSDGDDSPLTVLRSRASYDGIYDKDLAGDPELVYYEPSLANGTLYVWPVGDSGDTIYLNTRGQLTQFPDATTDIDIALGYKETMVANLAIRIAPMFEVSITQELAKTARESLANIKRLNRQNPVMSIDSAIPSKSSYNIEQG